MSFVLETNNLDRNADIKSISFKSEDYSVRIFYDGDYRADFNAGKCDVRRISMRCKESGRAFPLSFAAGQMMIEIPSMPLLYASEIEDVKRRLDKAGMAANELNSMIKQYFKI